MLYETSDVYEIVDVEMTDATEPLFDSSSSMQWEPTQSPTYQVATDMEIDEEEHKWTELPYTTYQLNIEHRNSQAAARFRRFRLSRITSLYRPKRLNHSGPRPVQVREKARGPASANFSGIKSTKIRRTRLPPFLFLSCLPPLSSYSLL